MIKILWVISLVVPGYVPWSLSSANMSRIEQASPVLGHWCSALDKGVPAFPKWPLLWPWLTFLYPFVNLCWSFSKPFFFFLFSPFYSPCLSLKFRLINNFIYSFNKKYIKPWICGKKHWAFSYEPSPLDGRCVFWRYIWHQWTFLIITSKCFL